MKSTLIIPKLCKVGFNKREDTYTGKLGYIIYHDGKVWRKEKSWESWREIYLDEIEYAKLKTEAYNEAVERKTNDYIFSYNHSQQFINKTIANYSYYSNYSKDSIQHYTEFVTKYPTVNDYLIQYKLDSIDKFDYRNPYQKNYTTDDSTIPIEFNNELTEGFVLNKQAGGYSSGWNHRQSVCRVYDPRGWEFEIKIDNLLYILSNTNCIKGKGLEGKFIYAWDKTNLVLLPESSIEYKQIIENQTNK